jgi:hypothetical protein
MVKVRVYRISSVNDPETGQAGKQIELVEVRSRPAQQTFPGVGEDEAKLVKGIMGQFQQIGIFPIGREIVIPKITLFLTEGEYDLLATRFEVNDTFELLIKDGAFMLKRSTEGV